MDYFLIIYRNIYIKNIIRYHLKLFNYYNYYTFNNYKDFKYFKYIKYLNEIIIEYKDHQELEKYFKCISNNGDDNIRSIHICGRKGRRSLNNKLKIPDGVQSFQFFSLYKFDFNEFELPTSLKQFNIIKSEIEYTNNNSSSISNYNSGDVMDDDVMDDDVMDNDVMDNDNGYDISNNNNNSDDYNIEDIYNEDIGNNYGSDGIGNNNNNNNNINNYNGLKFKILNESSLENIQLYSSFNKIIDLSNSNIKQLKITSSKFSEYINVGDLPVSLKRLEIGKPFIKSTVSYTLIPDVLPQGLTYLSIGIYENCIGKNVIPATVTTLRIGSLNQDLYEVIPPSCTALYTSSNQLITQIPTSITKLIYSNLNSNVCFLDTSLIPNSVRILTLASNQELIGQNRLSDSITELSIQRVNQIVIDEYLPNNESLKILELYNTPPTLQLNQFKSITTLSIISEVNDFNNLPSNLTSLYYFKNQNYNIIQQHQQDQIDHQQDQIEHQHYQHHNQLDNNNNNNNNNNNYNNNNNNNINFQNIFQSLKVIVIHCDNISNIILPTQLLALRIINYDSTLLDDILLPPSIKILQLSNFDSILINNQFINKLQSLQHLIISNSNHLKIEDLNINSNSNLNIYIDDSALLNTTKFNMDQLYLNNLNIITHNHNQLFSDFIFKIKS